MARHAWLSLLVASALVVFAGGAALAASVAIYRGTAGEAQLGPWGNGSIEKSEATKFDGASALEVKTKGYHEGGRYVLRSPVDLSRYFSAASSSHVLLKLKMGATATAAPRGGLPGMGLGMPRGPGMRTMPGGPGMPAMPGMPGADAGQLLLPVAVALGEGELAGKIHLAQLPALPGMPGEPGMPGMPGGMPAMPGGGMPGGMMGPPMMGMPPAMAPPSGGLGFLTQPTVSVKPLESVRIVLITDKGQIDLGAYELDSLKEKDGWRELRVRFKDLKAADPKDPGKLQAVVFTGNSAGSFFVGRMELVTGR